MNESAPLSRRRVVLAGFGAAAAAFLAACSRGGNGAAPAAQDAPTTSTAASPGSAPTAALAPTPECRDDDDVTPAQTEGPYFTAGSPERTDIRAGAGGSALVLTGTVLTTDCRAVPRALVDFWQADGSGAYDNSGFGFRGHQFTDADGRYRLETVVPGRYPGRTRHIHVKVQAPGGRVLTTQLYFPGEAQNASDGLYREECLVEMTGGGGNATFTFVLPG